MFTPVSQGLCSDANPCTVGDFCQAGACNSGGPKVCNDGDVCTADSCDKVTGACVFSGIPGCGGNCLAVTDCKDDANACTSTQCDLKIKKCVYPAVANGSACSDGNPCTIGDACKNGFCATTGPKDCSDGKVCTSDACDPGNGTCLHINADNIGCDDGNPCTVQDLCKTGACAGTKKACNDGLACTADSCDAKSGVCIHTGIPGCGINCAKDADCKDDGNVCTVHFCDPNKKCATKAAKNGLVCSDGSACTAGDSCANGKCAGGAPVVCDDKNACTLDKCDPATGKCFFVNTDGFCEDGDACTQLDKCADRNSKAHRLRGHHQNPTDSRPRTIQKHRRRAVCPTPSARQSLKPFVFSRIERTNPAQRQLSLLCARAE